MQNQNAKIFIQFERADWQEHAACRGQAKKFYPDEGGYTNEVFAVCAVCPVKDECLRYALKNDERFGVWGGLSPLQRQRLKRA